MTFYISRRQGHSRIRIRIGTDFKELLTAKRKKINPMGLLMAKTFIREVTSHIKIDDIDRRWLYKLLMEDLYNTIADDRHYIVKGFGTFTKRERKARTYSVPGKGTYAVPEGWHLSFKMSKKMSI